MKDILVHVPTERPLRAVVDGSISLGAAFGAHVEAIAAGYIRASTAYVVEGGAAVAAVFEMERERALERADAALSVFETEARNAHISYHCRAIADIPAETATTVGALARVHDLAVVMQPERDAGSFDDQLPHDIIFQTGGPVLFLPHIYRGEFRAKRIGLCWDGSRAAARAVRDAAPFLSRADQIVTITVNKDALPADASTDRLAAHLARKGWPTRDVHLAASRSEIQPIILSIAADESLDLLIMGAYGHSRLQEAVLGGVSRDMLETMTVPVLMSH